MVACSFAAGCLGGVSSSFINCSLPCVEEAGALSGTSPGLMLATPLFQCIANGAGEPVCLTE
jgi:hydrogenase/urease accessory protein HupE